MNKHELEQWLRDHLTDLPQGEVEGILIFYTGAIEDRMEDGMTEEEAVRALGRPEDILAAIRANRPTTYSPSRPPKRKKGLLWGVGVAILTLGIVLAVYSAVSAATGYSLLGRILGLRRDFGSTATPVPSDASQPVQVWEMAQGQVTEIAPGTADVLRVQEGDYTGYLIPVDRVDQVYLDQDWGNVQVELWEENCVQLQLLYPDEYVCSLGDGALWVEQQSYDARRWPAKLTKPVLRVLLPEGGISQLQVTIEAGDLTLTKLDLESLFVNVDAGNVALRGLTVRDCLEVDIDAGNLTLEEVISDNVIDVMVDAGNVTLDQADADQWLSVTVEAGSITGTLAGPASRYTAETHVSIGVCNLPASFVYGPVGLYLQVDVGNIDLKFTEAAQGRQALPEGDLIQTAVVTKAIDGTVYVEADRTARAGVR